jgi:prolyl-tRNA editing enzyme YbaK/EbsC (Cys-tRNA(Pro) deacylase)
MNLDGYLVSQKVYFEFLRKRSTCHAEEASEASGIPLAEIVKSLVFIDRDGKPLLTVVTGDTNVSRHKLEHCSGAKSVRLATER